MGHLALTKPGNVGTPLAYSPRISTRPRQDANHARSQDTFLPSPADLPNFQGFAAILAEYFAGGIVMQAALAELPSTRSSERTDLATWPRQHLERHPHFRGRLTGVANREPRTDSVSFRPAAHVLPEAAGPRSRAPPARRAARPQRDRRRQPVRRQQRARLNASALQRNHLRLAAGPCRSAS